MYKDLDRSLLTRNLDDISYRRSLVQDIDYTHLKSESETYSPALQELLHLNTNEMAEHLPLFQWCATLEFIATQINLRQSILDTIDAEAKRLGPAQATLMMYQDHRKTILALERYRSNLASRTPAYAESSVRHTYARRRSRSLLDTPLNDDPAQHIAWWSAHYALAKGLSLAQLESEGMEPVWAAHLQNLRVISAYHLEVCAAHLESLGVAKEEWKQAPTFISTLEAVFDLTLTSEIVSQSCGKTLKWDIGSIVGALASESNPQASPPPSQPLPLPKAYLRGEAYTHPPAPDLTLVGALEETIRRDPSAGIVYLRDGGEEHFETYAELRSRGLKICGQLRGMGVAAGTPIMVMVNRPEHFLSAFWASLLGGYLPIPMAGIMSLGRGNHDLLKLQAVLSKIDTPVVITDDELVEKFQGVIPPGFIHHLLGAQSLLTGDYPATDKPSPSGPDEIAFLQFSSGSTGLPKGVQLTHQNLLHNIRSIAEHQGGHGGQCFVSWLPLFHDMGIIGYHLLPMALGAKQVWMHPRQFMKRPRLWLDMLHKHKGTCTASPNFGLSRVVEKVKPEDIKDLDLSHVHNLLNGAEPISARIMESFLALVGPIGFARRAMSPGYGLAEGSLCISAKPIPDEPLVRWFDAEGLKSHGHIDQVPAGSRNARQFVDVGTAINGVEIRVVDDQDSLLAPSQIGHIQIRGPNVTRGYYRAPDITAESKCGDWHRTGDLGLVLDNHLIITGRAKDIIFVRGQNYYAHDLEASLVDLPHHMPGRLMIFDAPMSTGDGEELVLAAVFNCSQDEEREAFQASSKHIMTHFGIELTAIIAVGSKDIAKTTSGKLQRHIVRKRFMKGEFNDLVYRPEVQQVPTTGAPVTTASKDSPLDEKIAQIWTKILGRPMTRTDYQTDFQELGGTSLQAAEIHAELEDALGFAIPHTLLTESRTVEEMRLYLERECKDDLDALGGSESASAESRARRIVLEAWAEVLGFPLEHLALDAAFEEIGGTSLQAAEIHALIEDKLGGPVSHGLVIEAKTIHQMADYLTNEHPELFES